MPDYKPDPNDSKKQVPGPTNKYVSTRTSTVSPTSMSKTPHYVLVAADCTNTVGFFFGTSASFSSKVQEEAKPGTCYNLTGSGYYQIFGGEGTLKAGTRLDIHPMAWSGSATDSVTFIYKSGLSTGGF